MTNLESSLVIEIKYRDVPYEILSDFVIHDAPDLSINLVYDETEYFNFAGGPSDILIYINEHLTELIAGGLVVNAVYDGIKICITATWKRLVRFYSNSKNKYQTDKNKISIRFKIHQDKIVEYTLEGNVNDTLIENITDKLFEHLKNKETIEDTFKKSNFHDPNEMKPKIEMYYDTKSKKWEAIDFEKRKKDWDDYVNGLEMNLDS